MANTHINIGRSDDGLKSQARRGIDRLWETVEGFERLKRIMDEAAAPPDWTGVESLLGLSAGEGETVYNLIAGVNAVLQGSAVQQLVRRLG